MPENNYEIEKPTPEEELKVLIEQIENDMKVGKKSMACQGLKKIKDDKQKYNLLKTKELKELFNKFNKLNDKCEPKAKPS